MKRLRAIRLSNKLTQSDLAKQLGVSRTTITMWESGSSKPRLDKLIHLTKILDCTLDDLWHNKKI